MVHVVVLQRDELAVGRRAEAHALLGARPMPGRLEHHLAADHELHRPAELPRRRGGERAVRPWPELAAEARAQEPGDDANVLLRQPEHLREDAPEIEDPLRPLVERQRRPIPDRGRRVQLDGVVGLGRRDVGLVELDRRAGRTRASASPRWLCRRSRGPNVVTTTSGSSSASRLVVDVRLLLGVRHPDRVRRGLGGLERVRHRERDVLAVVADDVVLERRAALVGDAGESRPRHGAEDLPDVLAMKDRSHAGHLLGRRRVELDHAAIGDRRPHRNRIQHPGKVEVGGVLRLAAHLQRAIHARGVVDRSVTSPCSLLQECSARPRPFAGHA